MRRLLFSGVYQRDVVRLLDTLKRRRMETEISLQPLRWPVIPGSGGLRKARAGRGNRGKRSGVRVLYAFMPSRDFVVFLAIYAKAGQEDLGPREIRALREIVPSLVESADG